MNPSFPLRVCMTGVTSGIGKLTAELLLQHGHIVLAGVRDCAARIQRGDLLIHPNFHAVELDLAVGNDQSFMAIHEFIHARWDGRLDVLINAAGYGLLGPVELQSTAQIQQQLQVNFMAPLQLIQVCLPFLRVQRGKILNITSMAAFTVFPFYGTYAASKHALHAVSEALVYELKSSNIQVATIEPGAYHTSFQDSINLGTRDIPQRAVYADRMERFKQFRAMVSQKMEKDPHEVAQILVKLCESTRIRSRYVVGVDACINLVLRRILPDRIFIPLQRWVYEKHLF